MALLTRYDITDLSNGRVADFPVSSPPGWDDVSLYYAKALQQMGWKQSADGDTDVTSMWTYSDSPDSYFFQAAMHWWPRYPDSIPPSPYDERWSHCTHGPATAEQYFLPWHRAYIYFFEVLVRAQVKRLGGPDGWALPYWNYSFPGSDAAEPWPRSNLPWPFRQPQLPDGTPNPLYIADVAKRGLQPTWPGTSDPMFLEKTTPAYAAAYGQTAYERFNSTLDGRPHGAVHVDVGSGDLQVSQTGWMQSTVTASFDPIFWLHHSEIDRFWAGWNANGNANPPDQAWREASDDPLHDTRWSFWADGDLQNKLNVYPGDMEDPASLGPPFPHAYRYNDLPPVPARRAPFARPLVQLAALPAPRAAAEIAAAGAPVDLGHEATSAAVALSDSAPAALASLEGPPEEAPRVVLQLDDIVAQGPPGNYEVYLNYPDANRETAGSVPHFVGLLAGFGADHSHGEGHDHGLSASYDITELVAYLRSRGEWDERQATVTFVPAARPRPGRDLVTAPVTVGRVSIHTT